MLVLTRKVGEEVHLGDDGAAAVLSGDVTITVLRVSGNSVRLGIAAPRSVKITRPDRDSKAEDGVESFSEGLLT